MSRIVCVALPNLPIALARRDDPALAARPLVLYSAGRGRAVVHAATQDSRVAPGPPLRQARQHSATQTTSDQANLV